MHWRNKPVRILLYRRIPYYIKAFRKAGCFYLFKGNVRTRISVPAAVYNPAYRPIMCNG